MKKSYIIGVVVVVAALILAMFSFKSSLTSYVTIAEAKDKEQYVQVAGILVPGSVGFGESSHALLFTLKEPGGDTMNVQYLKSKPANFEGADKIVAIGKYDKNRQLFIADELLVKCPSKYEERISEQ